MGVMINLYFNEQFVSPAEATVLIDGVQTLVKRVMNKQDVFAFAINTSNFLSNDPIELFVQISALKISDAGGLADKLSEAITAWRTGNSFPHPINLNVVPVEWHARLGL